MHPFQRTEMLLGSDTMTRLSAAHIAIFGLGGVGGYAAEALARAGVGRLTIVDHDTVSLTNINRQLCALHSTVGKLKTEVVSQRLLDINSSLQLKSIAEMYTADTRERFFADYTYIIDAIDTVSCKLDLIETASARGIPILSSLGTGNKLDPARLRFADIYQTSGCPLARIMRNELRKRSVDQLRVLFSDEPPIKPLELETPAASRRSVPGSVSWVPSVAGLMLAGEAVRNIIRS